MEESLRRQRLSEEIGYIIISSHEGHTNLSSFHRLANEEMTTLNVLDPGMVRVYWNKKNVTFIQSIPIPTLSEAVQGISSAIV